MKGKLLTFLALALLVIPAASPYFLPGVPRTNDLTPHLMRTFFWGEAVSYSGLWPRWSAELVYGYGYPVFNFFPSLFHAFVQLVHQFGLPLLTAYRVVVYLHFLLAAVSSYLLGKEIFHSRLAGWGAAVVYVYSPYLLYDAIVRGSGPETQALALLPLLILAIWKSSNQLTVNSKQFTVSGGWGTAVRQSLILVLQSPKWVVLTAVIFALTFLSHPIAYQLLIPIGGWLLIKAGFAARRGHFDRLSDRKFSGRKLNGHFWHTLIGPILGIGLGGLMVAFYWLPAFVDVGFTRANTSISQGYAYQTNFLTLLDMLKWPVIPADPALINPPVVRAIPVVGLLWAAVVIMWHWRGSTRVQREIVAAWTAVLILSIWLITPTSQLVWDYFPLLRLTFYPWRLLSMTSVATAVLVALSMRMIEDRRLKIEKQTSLQSLIFYLFPSLLLTSLIVISAIPWLFPPRQTMPEEIDMAAALHEELPPLFIGTTTLGEFVPAQVTELPDYLPEDEQLRAGNNPDRLQAVAGLKWTRLDENPMDARYEVVTERPLTAVYRQFDFPGWRVQVDGETVPITPSDPHGLITFPIPTGTHAVEITFTNTWARWLGWAISTLAFAIVMGLVVFSMVNGNWLMANGKSVGNITQSSIVNPQSLILLGLTAVFIWLFFSFVDTPLRRSSLQANGILGKPETTPVDYAGEVRLLSYKAPTIPVTADDAIPLTLYFQAQREIGVPYNIGVQVVDENGLNWMADNTRPFDWRFIADDPWPLDAYRMEPYLISLMDGTPPGTYQFHVGLVRADTGQTMAAYDVGELVVSKPGRGEQTLENGMTAVLPNQTSQPLRLLGVRSDRSEAAPGDPVRLATLWQVQAPGADNQYTLQLVSAVAGTAVYEAEIPIAPAYPPEQWQPGDRLRSETVFRLPATTPDGRYIWRIVWGNTTADIDAPSVHAPARNFEEINVETAVGETFDDIATLLGVNTTPETGEVTLIWQAENETPTSYRVFVHLLDTDDSILSQSDGEPVSWSRPTTGWLPGEILQDTHQLTLDQAKETLRLCIGLYDPETGQRLATETGDSVTIEWFNLAD